MIVKEFRMIKLKGNLYFIGREDYFCWFWILMVFLVKYLRLGLKDHSCLCKKFQCFVVPGF